MTKRRAPPAPPRPSSHRPVRPRLQVLALDKSSAEHEELVAEITHWRSGEVPRYVKQCLIAGAAVMTASYQIQLLFAARCFREFSLYPDYDTQLRDELGGRLSRLVRPLGWLALLGATVSYVLFSVSSRWAARYVKQQEAAGRKPKRMSQAGKPPAAGGADAELNATHVAVAAMPLTA